MSKNYKLAPSILSADFAVLGDNLRTLVDAGAHMVHFDVMDGHFVPNLSFGLPVLASIRTVTDLPFDVHLMIDNPLAYLSEYAQAGADSITVHWEVVGDMVACLKKIRNLGVSPAFAVKPATPASDILAASEYADTVLIMSVEPGFGGQMLMPETLRKSEALANYIQQNKLNTQVQMDGGINTDNVRSVLDAGVNIVVAGSAVFAPEPEVMTQRIKTFLDIMTQ